MELASGRVGVGRLQSGGHLTAARPRQGSTGRAPTRAASAAAAGDCHVSTRALPVVVMVAGESSMPGLARERAVDLLSLSRLQRQPVPERIMT